MSNDHEVVIGEYELSEGSVGCEIGNRRRGWIDKATKPQREKNNPR